MSDTFRCQGQIRANSVTSKWRLALAGRRTTEFAPPPYAVPAPRLTRLFSSSLARAVLRACSASLRAADSVEGSHSPGCDGLPMSRACRHSESPYRLSALPCSPAAASATTKHPLRTL